MVRIGRPSPGAPVSENGHGAAGGGGRTATDHGSLGAGVRARTGRPGWSAGWLAGWLEEQSRQALAQVPYARSGPAATPVMPRSPRRSSGSTRRLPPSTPRCRESRGRASRNLMRCSVTCLSARSASAPDGPAAAQNATARRGWPPASSPAHPPATDAAPRPAAQQGGAVVSGALAGRPAPRTCRAPGTSTRTGGFRSVTARARPCCSRTCPVSDSRTRSRARPPGRAGRSRTARRARGPPRRRAACTAALVRRRPGPRTRACAVRPAGWPGRGSLRQHRRPPG